MWLRRRCDGIGIAGPNSARKKLEELKDTHLEKTRHGLETANNSEIKAILERTEEDDAARKKAFPVSTDGVRVGSVMTPAEPGSYVWRPGV